MIAFIVMDLVLLALDSPQNQDRFLIPYLPYANVAFITLYSLEMVSLTFTQPCD